MNDELLKLRQTARQMVFRTGEQSTPITIGGTYFLVTYRERLFAVTAKHVVRDCVPEQLLLSTSDNHWIPARVIEQFNVSNDGSDALDLVVYDLDTRHFIAKHRKNSRAYNMPLVDPIWMQRYYECGFFFFGYPLSRARVAYGMFTTQATNEQWFVTATYQRRSEVEHGHVLKIANPHCLDGLDGLSGSPVFAYQNLIGVEAKPFFAGVVLRGTASSGLVHFLEGSVVRTALDHVVSRPRRALPKKWRSLKTRARRMPVRHQ